MENVNSDVNLDDCDVKKEEITDELTFRQENPNFIQDMINILKKEDSDSLDEPGDLNSNSNYKVIINQECHEAIKEELGGVKNNETDVTIDSDDIEHYAENINDPTTTRNILCEMFNHVKNLTKDVSSINKKLDDHLEFCNAENLNSLKITMKKLETELQRARTLPVTNTNQINQEEHNIYKNNLANNLQCFTTNTVIEKQDRDTLDEQEDLKSRGMKNQQCHEDIMEDDKEHNLQPLTLTDKGTHKPSSKSYQCPVCRKTFKHMSALKRHEVIHTGERKYQCHTCGYKSTLLGNLKTHMVTHTGEKNHGCKICGKRFSQSSALNRHYLSHTGAEKHACDECGKLYSTSSNLKTHQLTQHTGENRYPCNICGKTFAYSSYIKLHQLTHSREKPHACKICGKIFARLNTLKNHILTHTGKKKWPEKKEP